MTYPVTQLQQRWFFSSSVLLSTKNLENKSSYNNISSSVYEM